MPEKVLEYLQNGEQPGHLAKRAADETEERISHLTLLKDIQKWKESASWGGQFVAALKLMRRDGKGGYRITSDWYEDFYTAMQEEGIDGKIRDACAKVGVGSELVYALRDKRNKCYDATFDEQCRILEGRRIAGIRESVLEMAHLDGKVGLKVLESSMPSLHAPHQKLEVTGKIDHEHTHQMRLPPEVVAASQARTKTLMSSRRPVASLPETTRALETVIDDIPVEETELVGVEVEVDDE